jgi:hypothetical protein
MYWKTIIGLIILSLFFLYQIGAQSPQMREFERQRQVAMAVKPELERQRNDLKRAASECEYLLKINDAKAIECAIAVTEQAKQLTAKINSYMPH